MVLLPKDPMANDPYPAVLPDGYGTQSRGEGIAPQIRHNDPKVANHIARLLIRNNMDYQSVVSLMLKDREHTDVHVIALAQTLEKSPRVQEALQLVYSRMEIDDGSLKVFRSVLWEDFVSRDASPSAVKKKIAAARILAEWFGIGKKADEANRPQTLPIAGMEDGLRQMFGGTLPNPDQMVPVNPTGLAHDDTIEDDDEESNV